MCLVAWLRYIETMPSTMKYTASREATLVWGFFVFHNDFSIIELHLLEVRPEVEDEVVVLVHDLRRLLVLLLED